MALHSAQTIDLESQEEKQISLVTFTSKVCTFEEYSKNFNYVFPSIVSHSEMAKKKGKISFSLLDGSVVRCTEGHKFYLINNELIEAKYLRVGMRLRNKKYSKELGEYCSEVVHVSLPFLDSDSYYDMGVSITHNYVLENGLISSN